MYIFLGIVCELVTVAGSVFIVAKGILDSVVQMSENGYRLDKNVYNKYNKYNKKQNKIIKGIGIIKKFLFFVPGLNLIFAGVQSVKIRKKMMNDLQKEEIVLMKEGIVLMNDQEKEQYSKMKGKIQKFIFNVIVTSKKKDEEFLGFIGNTPVVVYPGLISLGYEELPHYNYTLDEVKKLNEATTYSYRIGTIGEKNVAIIGIPNPNSTVSKIQFKSEEYKITHDYVKMTEEKAQDKTFIVYPFMSNTREAVKKVVEEIKYSRVLSETQANLKALNTQTQIQEYSVENCKEQEGPVLKKTLYPPKK